ncbi:MAG: hypothetical protein CO129_08595 [Ignavibacteriales bacterium CG_4_9_14_3_um_filter_34_10]|nr:MAG: hypothetical protein CO129_08595 [Ignavibacteriales bacterium CG_4_9_14_3_um_filter_34_10]
MYNFLLTIHIIAAGIWLTNFIFSGLINNQLEGKNLKENLSLVKFYLRYSNILGMVGSLLILFTGVFLVISSSHFGFFTMKANHWLTTKQIIMVVILLLTFISLIPKAKKLKALLSGSSLTDGQTELKAFNKINFILNVLVLINFLFALSHRLMG